MRKVKVMGRPVWDLPIDHLNTPTSLNGFDSYLTSRESSFYKVNRKEVRISWKDHELNTNSSAISSSWPHIRYKQKMKINKKEQ